MMTLCLRCKRSSILSDAMHGLKQFCVRADREAVLVARASTAEFDCEIQKAASESQQKKIQLLERQTTNLPSGCGTMQTSQLYSYPPGGSAAAGGDCCLLP